MADTNDAQPPVTVQPTDDDQDDRRQGILQEILAMPKTEFVQSDRAFKPEDGHTLIGIMTDAERAAYTIADRESDKLIARTKELAPMVEGLDEAGTDKIIEAELLPLVARFHCASEIMWVLICQRLGFNAMHNAGICQDWQIAKIPPQDDEDDEDSHPRFSRYGRDRFDVKVLSGGNLPPEVRRGIERYLEKNLRRRPGGGITIVDEEEDDPFLKPPTASKGSNTVN